MRPPGEWQTYDIVFNEPEFNAAGEKIKSGNFYDVFHNGVLVQNSVEILGTTEYIGLPKNGRDDLFGSYPSEKSRHRSLMLQDHGDLVSFTEIFGCVNSNLKMRSFLFLTFLKVLFGRIRFAFFGKFYVYFSLV